MIIRYTKAEQEELNRVEKYYEDQLDSVAIAMHSGSVKGPEADAEMRRLTAERASALRAKNKEFEDIRFSKISRSPQKIKDNAQTQTTAIIKKLQHTVEQYRPISPEERKQRFEFLEDKTDSEILDMIEPFPDIFYGIIPEVESTEGEVARLEADQIIDIIKKDLYRHYERLSEEDCNDLDTFIEQAVYEALEKQPGQALEVPTAYFRMYHDNFVDTLPQMSRYALQENKSTAADAFYITVGKTRVDIGNPQGFSIALGIPSHKLLVTALEQITSDPSHNTVIIPTKEYFKSAGYTISNPATMEKYINRTGEYLKTLQMMVITEGRGRGKSREIDHLSIIRKSHIDINNITITFDPIYVNYLKQRKIQMQYPRTLLSLGGKSPNPYRMGFKIAMHSSNYNNIVRGSNNILEVSSLLNVTDLPLIETIREQRGSWIRKIRDPFEKALDKLVEQGLLTKWYYCKAKSRKLNPQERETARSKYETWERCYIHFELKDSPEQSKAIQRNRERKQATASKTQNNVPG